MCQICLQSVVSEEQPVRTENVDNRSRNNTVNISNSYTKSCSSSGKTSVYFAYNMCFDRAVQLQQQVHSMLATIKTTVATTSATPITITTDDVSEIIV